MSAGTNERLDLRERPYGVWWRPTGMIGIVMTRSYPLVAPLGGRRPMLGDAPMGFGVPAGDRDPVILDMALTNSSATGIRHVAGENLVAGSEAPGTPRSRPDPRHTERPFKSATTTDRS